jgi:hypothetical protein
MNKTISKKIGIWFLAFSLFACQLFFRSVAHAESSSNWMKIFAKSGDCHISFPCAPQMIQQTLPLADGVNRLSYDVYLAPHGEKGVFLLLIATYPNALSNGHEIAGLEGLINGIVNHSSGNELVYADLVDFHGKQAVNFLVEGGDNYFRGTALMVGNKLYLIGMEGLKLHMDESAFIRFLKSFKLS